MVDDVRLTTFSIFLRKAEALKEREREMPPGLGGGEGEESRVRKRIKLPRLPLEDPESCEFTFRNFERNSPVIPRKEFVRSESGEEDLNDDRGEEDRDEDLDDRGEDDLNEDRGEEDRDEGLDDRGEGGEVDIGETVLVAITRIFSVMF